MDELIGQYEPSDLISPRFALAGFASQQVKAGALSTEKAKFYSSLSDDQGRPLKLLLVSNKLFDASSIVGKKELSGKFSDVVEGVFRPLFEVADSIDMGKSNQSFRSEMLAMATNPKLSASEIKRLLRAMYDAGIRILGEDGTPWSEVLLNYLESVTGGETFTGKTFTGESFTKEVVVPPIKIRESCIKIRESCIKIIPQQPRPLVVSIPKIMPTGSTPEERMASLLTSIENLSEEDQRDALLQYALEATDQLRAIKTGGNEFEQLDKEASILLDRARVTVAHSIGVVTTDLQSITNDLYAILSKLNQMSAARRQMSQVPGSPTRPTISQTSSGAIEHELEILRTALSSTVTERKNLAKMLSQQSLKLISERNYPKRTAIEASAFLAGELDMVSIQKFRDLLGDAEKKNDLKILIANQYGLSILREVCEFVLYSIVHFIVKGGRLLDQLKLVQASIYKPYSASECASAIALSAWTVSTAHSRAEYYADFDRIGENVLHAKIRDVHGEIIKETLNLVVKISDDLKVGYPSVLNKPSNRSDLQAYLEKLYKDRTSKDLRMDVGLDLIASALFSNDPTDIVSTIVHRMTVWYGATFRYVYKIKGAATKRGKTSKSGSKTDGTELGTIVMENVLQWTMGLLGVGGITDALYSSIEKVLALPRWTAPTDALKEDSIDLKERITKYLVAPSNSPIKRGNAITEFMRSHLDGVLRSLFPRFVFVV